MLNDLTVVMCNYKSHRYVQLNRQTMIGEPAEWIIINNGNEDLSMLKFAKILPGIKVPDSLKKQLTGEIGVGSCHHALALNSSLPHIKTQYVLFLDPDFFVVQSLQSVLEFMRNEDIDFFGGQYAKKKRFSKRIAPDFPGCFCLIVNRARIDISDWNFIPDIDGYNKNPRVMYDTGSRIYQRYLKSKYIGLKPTTITDHKLDLYDWRDKRFGVHIRAKIHLGKRESLFDKHKFLLKRYSR